jgi:hypothetical protein
MRLPSLGDRVSNRPRVVFAAGRPDGAAYRDGVTCFGAYVLRVLSDAFGPIRYDKFVARPQLIRSMPI